MTARNLERVLYYEDYMVIDPGDTPLQEKQLLSEMEYREAQEKYGDAFVAKMGAEACAKLLASIDLERADRAAAGGHGEPPEQADRKKLPSA
jgi:DNA-directed RNA polymerase subunit beta'